jgi:molecular chaperone GrpE
VSDAKNDVLPEEEESPRVASPPDEESASSNGADAAESPDAADAKGDGDASHEATSAEHAATSADADPAAQVEADLDDAIAAIQRERDDYLDALRRLQADFENYKKRMLRQQTDLLDRAGEELIEKLLPVLDAIDLARQHDAGEGVDAIAGALTDALEKQGLERIDPVGEPFDPNEHEAVMHQPAEDGDGGQVVASLMRAGYRWKGRLVRPAMVAVRG